MKIVFPQFVKLRLSHRQIIKQFTNQYAPYSDFDFTSMYTYDTQQKLRWTVLNNNLVVLFTDYLTNKPFLSFLGHHKVIKTAAVLLDYAKKHSLPPVLKLVPEIVIKHSNQWSKYFQIKPDRDNDDYLVLAKEIATLPEQKYRRKLSLVNKFKRQNPGYDIKISALSKEAVQNTVLTLFKHWQKVNHKNSDETETEFMAIKRMCQNAAKLKIFTLLIYVNDQPVAFNTFEIDHKGYAISSFQKADKNFRGIYTVLSHEVARFVYQKHCRYLNYEQDLGIEGLRLSKSLWKPAKFLKKFIIKPK